MPYLNEHAARIKNPDDFKSDSIRRKTIVDGIDIIIGKLKSGGSSMVTQAYRFDEKKFTVAEAKKWLKEHDVDYISFEPASKQKSKNEEGGEKIMGEEVKKTNLEMLDELAKKIADKVIAKSTEGIGEEKEEGETKEAKVVKSENKGEEKKEGDSEIAKSMKTLADGISLLVAEMSKKKNEEIAAKRATEQKNLIVENIKEIVKEMGIDVESFGKRKGVVNVEKGSHKTENDEATEPDADDDLTKGLDPETISMVKYRKQPKEVQDALMCKAFTSRMGIGEMKTLMSEIESLEE